MICGGAGFRVWGHSAWGEFEPEAVIQAGRSIEGCFAGAASWSGSSRMRSLGASLAERSLWRGASTVQTPAQSGDQNMLQRIAVHAQAEIGLICRVGVMVARAVRVSACYALEV